jgi:DNA-directed RNA polymerase specialized sigma subunit
MNAEEFLLQVEKIDTIIKNKLIEKEQWLDIAQSISPPGFDEKVQSSPNPGRMTNAIYKVIDIENEIDSYIDILYETKKDVLSVIESLKISEYLLLHNVYIQFHTLKETADVLSRCYSWVTTTHQKALQNVQKILDERSYNATDYGKVES